MYAKKDFVNLHLISDNSTDFLFLTETWLQDKITDAMVTPSDFQILRSDRTYSHGGGVALLHKNHFDVNVVLLDDAILSKLYPTLNNIEFLCVDIYNLDLRTRYICFYIPPNFSKCLQTISTVCTVIDSLSNPFSPCFVIGDFNLPNIDWKIPISKGDASHNYFLNFCTQI